MAFEMGPETRQVQAMWDVSTYKYKVDGRGMKLLVDSMKEKKLRGFRCHECGMVYVPGPTFCRKCFIDIDEVVEVQDTGTIMSYAVELTDVRGNPLDQWRVSAQIKLDGADSFIGGTIEVPDWHDIHIDQKVKAVWIDNPAGTLSDIDHFEPM
jgi:uncharacterized OB-fold protein